MKLVAGLWLCKYLLRTCFAFNLLIECADHLMAFCVEAEVGHCAVGFVGFEV